MERDAADQDTGEITGLLKAWGRGDTTALPHLTELLYQHLRRIARRYVRGQMPGNSVQATALVNELYLRLVDVKNVEWQQRGQFLALCAEIMRRILVDAARTRGAGKRGGHIVKLNIDDVAVLHPEPDRFILALDDALEEFAKCAPRQAKVVELRYFGGMTEQEVAETLKSSTRSVRRDWQFAKAWITRALNRSG